MSPKAVKFNNDGLDQSVVINMDGMDRSANVNQNEFDDIDTKHEFLRRVFGILFVQLLITLGFVAFFKFYEKSEQLVKDNPQILLTALVMFIVMYFIILCPCCFCIMEVFPLNWIVLILFTLSMAFLTGVSTSQYGIKGVFQALIATVIIVLILTLFALQTSCDFTSCGTMLCMMTLIVIIFGSVLIAFSVGAEEKEKAQMVYSSLLAIIFCMYIIFDVQMIVGGSHPRAAQLGPDMYIYAAVCLYIDIVNLFLILLRLLGDKDN